MSHQKPFFNEIAERRFKGVWTGTQLADHVACDDPAMISNVTLAFKILSFKLRLSQLLVPVTRRRKATMDNFVLKQFAFDFLAPFPHQHLSVALVGFEFAGHMPMGGGGGHGRIGLGAHLPVAA